ncbi:MAG TPA: hypothetical protein ENG56_00320 [Candidatus Aenigmarchaeota archaeon]|nr:hypothetical protein [Candidatus Aenigmarchaeota archaeon]
MDKISEISKIEEIDANLSVIIEGLPEGKLKEFAERTKKDFHSLMDVLLDIEEKLEGIVKKLKEVI